MRVLVTGGSGFIGTNLIEYHLSKGEAVTNLDIAPPGTPNISLTGEKWIF